MNNFLQRVLTGAALILVITSAAYCNRYTFVLLILLINILSLSEFYRLACSGTRFGLLLAGYLISVSLLLSTVIVSCNHQLYWMATINLPLIFGVFILSLYSQSPQPFQRMAMILMALICVTVPLCFFIALAFYPFSVEVYHAQLVLGYFILLWVYDSFAYLAGKAFGAHTLFKRISPKKTWEGVLGACLAVIYAAYFLAAYFRLLTVTQWVGMALLIVIFGTYGDLIKSMLKRSAGVKDSGTILPGHGGMLDRFDSLLGSAPIVFAYLLFTQHA